MISVVHVREFDGRSHQDGQKIGRERDILLGHLRRGFGNVGGLRAKIALEINHRRRRISRGQRHVGGGRVALVETMIKEGFGSVTMPSITT